MGNALRSLSDENSLTSWSIYNENSGYISVKIRFKLATGAENHGAGLQYKRKSIKQANRDHERSKAGELLARLTDQVITRVKWTR